MIFLTLNELKELNNKNPSLSWDNLSNHPNLTIEWLKEFPDKPWRWFYGISQHPNLTIEWLKEFPDKRWNWDTYDVNTSITLSNHPNVTIEWLQEFPDKDWDCTYLSKHPNLTIEWLKEFPDKNWYWGIINMEKLTVNYIQMWYKNMKNKEKYWKYLEYYESQHMHPEGNYIKNMIINFDK